jgi:hypothetical protein
MWLRATPSSIWGGSRATQEVGLTLATFGVARAPPLNHGVAGEPLQKRPALFLGLSRRPQQKRMFKQLLVQETK